MLSRGIRETSYDLARIVDPMDISPYAARDIDGSKAPPGIQKPMPPCHGIIEASNHIPSVINTKDRGVKAARDVNRGKASSSVYKPMCFQCRKFLEASYNLSCIINA
jgi:hypothetical protein